MKYVRVSVIISVLFLILSLLAACGSGATEAPADEQTQQTGQEVSPTETSSQASEEGTEPTDAEQAEEAALPEDVPIMDNIRDFQATSDFTNISYVVDLEISDVVSWYQAELPNYGWELGRAPDSALGSIANMSRVNANNDRLTISLQHNPVGEFTVVRIVVVRAP